jgi:hypothetical protein
LDALSFKLLEEAMSAGAGKTVVVVRCGEGFEVLQAGIATHVIAVDTDGRPILLASTKYDGCKNITFWWEISARFRLLHVG